MTKERAISHLKDISMWGIVQADEYNALKMAIAELQKKPKTGKWVKVIEENGNKFYMCSVCKEGTDEDYDWCPYCGCRMKGENK